MARMVLVLAHLQSDLKTEARWVKVVFTVFVYPYLVDTEQ